MRILYVSQLGGGHDSYIMRIAQWLIRSGHQVVVLYLSYSRVEERRWREGDVEFIEAGLYGLHYYFSKLPFIGNRYALIVRSLEYMYVLRRVVLKEVKSNKVSIVEIPEVMYSRILLKHVPIVVRMHSLDWIWRKYADSKPVGRRSFDMFAERRLLRSASAVCSPSHALVNSVEKVCNLKICAKITPYPLDTSAWQPRHENLDNDVILFVGRVERRKGADALIRAMKRVWLVRPNAKLILVGSVDPKMDEMLESSKDDRIVIIGKVALDRLQKYYCLATLLAVPSRWDNSPNVIYEGMASGLPVVATNVGGIPELVRDGETGYLVEVDDDEALAGRIFDILTNPRLAEDMGRAAREIAISQYDIAVVADETLEHYRKVIEEWLH